MVSHFHILNPFPISCHDSLGGPSSILSCPVWDEPHTPCLPGGSCLCLPCPGFQRGKKNPHLSRRGSGAELGVSRVKIPLAFPVAGPCFLINSVKKPQEPKMQQGLKMTQLKEYNWIWRGEACFKREFLGCLFLKG